MAAWLSRLIGQKGRLAASVGLAAPLSRDLPADVLEEALSRAAVESGRPMAEFEAELRAENDGWTGRVGHVIRAGGAGSGQG